MTQRGSETYLDCLTMESLHIGIKLSNFHSFTIYLHVSLCMLEWETAPPQEITTIG